MEAWQLAVATVTRRAAADRPNAIARLSRILDAHRTVDDADRLRSVGRITLNFHPDRVAADGRTAAAGLAASGRYRSQWVTWTSGGGRTAVPGGDRERWEHDLFGGAYDGCDPTETEFPLYGALDLLHDPMGGSPRFGSCYLVLADHAADRTTFCVGDSHVGPSDVGAAGEMASILAGLADQAECRYLLDRDLGTDELLQLLDGQLAPQPAARDLDGYVEAQVHGGVALTDDVVALVADPSFRGTDVGDQLARLSDDHRLELRWHAGSRLAVSDVPDDFRGPTMVALAAEVADGSGFVDAASIGRSARAISPTSPTFSGDSGDSPAQQLKYLWHCVLALGHDAEPVAPI